MCANATSRPGLLIFAYIMTPFMFKLVRGLIVRGSVLQSGDCRLPFSYRNFRTIKCNKNIDFLEFNKY